MKYNTILAAVVGCLCVGRCCAGLTVDADLPAGNIIVDGVNGDIVKVRQDLRDSNMWFYWAFRVRGAAGRTLKFDFTEKTWGGPVGVRGPVVSTDGGRTFSYPLDGKSRTDGFTYSFGADENDVLFYECHPYVRANWDAFVAKHSDAIGRKFVVETLCKSRKGADVPRARFGCIAGEPKFRIFMSARHHCSETMASWVLEGVAESFLADDDLGRWLRENVELMMVPFVDYDGAQAGDQGKVRKPHDHNRDYTEFIYPETKAITEWIADHAGGRLDMFIDVHCPWVRGKYNEWLYTPWKDPKILPDVAAERRFSALLEKLQCGTMRYRVADDLQFGKEWNKGINYSQGWSGVIWACHRVKGLKIARSFEVPFANANGAIVTPVTCRDLGHDTVKVFRAMLDESPTLARPAPRPALAARLAEGPEIYGIVHWGLNTYTDREWGFGDEDPAMLNPGGFDADQIVGACKAGGLGGLVVVAKHHDGFCLWPTKTTGHNISKSPFRSGRGDYVKEMSEACRRAGLKFGVYVSPWDRNSAHYATGKYVEIYHAQIRELLGGGYGEVFEMWFDGANGGDGWYGGANEKRKIGAGYYRFDEVFRFVRALQPRVAVFSGENDDSDFRWPGNERGILDPDSRATVCSVGGFANGKYGNPDYKAQINTGSPGGDRFRVCESDFPLRRGWFYHEKERGTTKSAAYLAKLYLSSVGNGGTMNIGVAPDKSGRLDAADVRALAGFGVVRNALFAREAKAGEPFNVVVMREDISNGEQVDEWEFVADGKAILRGKSVGRKRIRVLKAPCTAKRCELKVLKDGGGLKGVAFALYRADQDLVDTVLGASGDDRETDTAKWMTGK